MHTSPNKRLLGLALTTALTSITLAGCSSAPSDSAAFSAAQAESAVAKGQNAQAVAYAETAVQADPRNAVYRATLGSAYLEAGRFEAASTSFADAIELGDNSARTALSYALASVGAGHQDAAIDTLRQWEGAMDPGDFGLALALAGRPAQGAHVLGNAIRNGNNTAKIRQNLAYAMALAGDWRSARVMAAEDVPADQLGDRLADWAATSAPEFYQQRVARLLGTPLVADSGMPAHLALSNFPENAAQLAAVEPAPESPAFAEAFPAGEAPVAAVAMADEPAPVVEAIFSGQRYVSNPVVQQLPARSSTPAAAPVRTARIASAPVAKPAAKAPVKLASGDHRVQLGSFTSLASAERAKGVYASKYPQLNASSFAITRAEVNGKSYYRVSAGDLSKASANSMCSSIKAKGNGCLAYAESYSMPGTVERNSRVASR